MANNEIRIKTERGVETTLGIKKEKVGKSSSQKPAKSSQKSIAKPLSIKKEKVDSVQKASKSTENPIAKSNTQPWNEEKRKLIDRIASLQTENQRTVLLLKSKEANFTAEKQMLQQQFSHKALSLSNEIKSLQSQLLSAKNELCAEKKSSGGKVASLNSENQKLRAVVKQLKHAQSNANDSLDDFYEVEKLMAHKKEMDGFHYLVRWANYSAADDTWQKESDLKCPKILDEYKRKMKIKSK